MKFTLNWLKTYLDTQASLADILRGLDDVGLEVEGVENPADKLGAFTVAEILSAEKHPDADKLQVCKVNTGTETIQIVCGAPNARAGIKVVLGRPGDYVPGIDVTLKPASIRGIESNGMMCSARELELGDDHDGIIELPDGAVVGDKYVDFAGLDDPIIEIAITPNRQDCLGVFGIARDLAAAGFGTFTGVAPQAIKGTFKSPINIKLETAECPIFMGRLIKGIKNGPSPLWLQDRLKAIGLRPISTLVDITNFITYDRARPLHVYDADKLTGNICARAGIAGESFEALDDKTYILSGGETIIADDKNVLGFGGIMGGTMSGCSENTTNVFLESAWFEPISTAITGRSFGIESDARYRFERGVDPMALQDGIEQATALILELCGGEASEVVSTGIAPSIGKTVTFRAERVMSLGGLDLPAETSVAILERLGFTVEGNGPFTVTVPSWRRDVDGEADLVEEVLRIHGLNNVPSVALPPLGKKAGSTLTQNQRRARAIKRRLASVGLMEAVTWSFMNDKQAEIFGGGGDDLIIENPISSDLNCMRPSILPNLMQAAQRNRDRGASIIALFEVGPQYRDSSEDGQDLVAAGVRAAKFSERNWADTQRDVNVFDAKADALAGLDAIDAPVDSLQAFSEAPEWYHPGRSGTLRLGAKTILAAFGEIHPAILTKLDIEGPMVAFEIFVEKIPSRRAKSASRGALSISNLQMVERDFAFIADRSLSASDLIKAVKGADKGHIKEVRVFDVYEGDRIDEDKKSIAISVTLEPQGQTFSDKEIEIICDKVIAAATKSEGVTLRS